jgi:hypothetical protein
MFKFLIGSLFNAEARLDLLRRRSNPQVRAVKKRLKRLVPGKSPRDQYLRSFIEEEVDSQWSLIEYTLPGVFQGIDDELQHLSTHGLPSLENAVFSVPDAFRQPYEMVFPAVHDRIQRGLVDTSRAEVALVEVFYDFLTRWGPTFERLEDHHQIQLLEICDRAVAKANGVADQPESEPLRPWVRAEPGSASRIPDVALRRLATDVLRCVDDEFRRHKEQADAHVPPGMAS